VGLSPLGTATTSGLLYQPQMISEGDYGAIGGMIIAKGNRSTPRKPAPAPLCPPQIPLDQTRTLVLLWEKIISVWEQILSKTFRYNTNETSKRFWICFRSPDIWGEFTCSKLASESCGDAQLEMSYQPLRSDQLSLIKTMSVTSKYSREDYTSGPNA
jgi:hypothetical protein